MQWPTKIREGSGAWATSSWWHLPRPAALLQGARHDPAVGESGVLRAEVESALEGRRLVRRMWFRADSPFVRMELKGSAIKRRTVTCRFGTRLNPIDVLMDVPGGVVSRPLVKVYDPTFWQHPVLHISWTQ